MKNIIHTFVLFLLLFSFQALADKMELVFKGQKQIVEFNPADKTDMDRAWSLWRKSENQKSYVYSETGIFKVYNEPRDDAKFKEIGSWYLELNTLDEQSPEIVHFTWDKSKWHPRKYYPEDGWIKLDDPNLIYPDQLKPVKEWPIRYMAFYIDRAATEESIKPKYDDYDRVQFDREGYLLDNRTMKRKKSADGNLLRMFQYRQFARAVAVSPNALDVRLENGGAPVKFNLKQLLDSPKVEYDKNSGYISIWGSFDDPVKPVLDKSNGNACVIDCENRKRWEP